MICFMLWGTNTAPVTQGIKMPAYFIALDILTDTNTALHSLRYFLLCPIDLAL